MKKLLWLDDIRNPHENGWLLFSPIPVPYHICLATSYKQFVSWIQQNGLPDGICFDHDLGEEKTGYDCAKWLVNFCQDNNYNLPKWNVHSQNPVGKENINCILKNYNKIQTTMTPTPEEINNNSPFEFFKNRMYQHNSRNQFSPSVCAECNLDSTSIEIFNESMKEYEKILYQNKIEKAGSELPSGDDIKNEFKKIFNGDLIEEIRFATGADFVKQAASIVILKEREKANGAWDDLAETSIEQIGILNNEIYELKSSIQKAFDEIWRTQMYPIETKGQPKGDDILKKYFPFIK